MHPIKQMIGVCSVLVLLQSAAIGQQESPLNGSKVEPDSGLIDGEATILKYALTEEFVCDATIEGDVCYLGEASQDGSTAAFVIENKKKWYVVWNGNKSKGYDRILGVYVSPRGRRCGFSAVKGDDRYAVVDGEEFGKYRRLTDSITFSSDGSQYLFSALKKGTFSDGAVTVLNGDEKKWKNVLITGPNYFSPDGTRSAFFVRDGKKHRAVIDGQKGPKYDLTGLGPYWSANGSNLAYMGSRNDTMFVVVNGEERGGHTTITSLEFSPDGSELAYTASENFDYFMIKGDKRLGPYQEVWDPTYSADGSHFSFLAMRDGKIFIVADEVEHTPHRDVSMPIYSQSGDRLAYTIRRSSDDDDSTQAAWIDGVIGPEYDYVFPTTFVFSPDDKHCGYIAEIDSLRLVAVIDGVVGKEYQQIDIVELSDSGYVYRAKKSDSAWCVVTNGKESREFQHVRSLAYSPDRSHTACFVWISGRWHLWIDGQLLGDYARVRPAIPVFSDDGAIHFFAVVNSGTVSSVTASPE